MGFLTAALILPERGPRLPAKPAHPAEEAHRLLVRCDRRLCPQDPLAIPQDEDPMAVALLAQRKLSLDEAQELVAG